MKRSFAVGGVVTVLIAALLPVYFAAAATTDSTWLSEAAPVVTKTGDLPENIVPFSAARDCGDTCYGSVSAGQYVDNTFNDGKNGWGPLLWYFLFPGPSSKVTFATTDMTKFRIYTDILGSDVKYTPTSNHGGQYALQRAPNGKFTSERTGQEMTNVGVTGAAFSNNGKWMAMHVTDPYSNKGSLAIFDTETFVGRVIAPNSGNTYYWGNGGNSTPGIGNLAVSDDGRYVADSFTQQTPGTGAKEYGVRVYDTTTCTDQYGISGTRANCTYKNAWTGKVNGASKNSVGIVEQLSGNPERPLNVRFKDNGTLTFTAIYDYVSYTDFKAGTYEATVAQTPTPEPIKLLAMGDSYISGEGAYSYREGTDTSENKCHQSTVSYPYLLGATYAAEYHSVACSGAVTDDIINSSDEYQNQLIPKQQQSALEIPTPELISNHSPGYINQLQFVSNTKPDTILLSIGGNDIAFADIVKRCVISFAWDPCYHRQSERKSLLLTIYSKYAALRATYTKILSEAPRGARLYVMGYPQVVNTTGNCGVNVHLDDSERQFAAMLIDRLNTTIRAAADSSGAVYVDISGALTGHRLCDSSDDGVNGVTNGNDTPSIGIFLGAKNYAFGLGNESYHPTALGHRLIGQAIARETNDLTKTSPGAANVLLPTLRDDDEFITTGAVDSGTIRRIEQKDILDANIVSAGTNLSLDVDTASLAQGSAYQVVFHSEEVGVTSGTLPSAGNLRLDIRVPNLAPGIHSVHVYTKDATGEDVDIAEDIYVVAGKDDFDGDGIRNEDDAWPFINETGTVTVEPIDVDTTTSSNAKQPQAATTTHAAAMATQTALAVVSTPVASTDLVSKTLDGATAPEVLGASDVVTLPDGKNKVVASLSYNGKRASKIGWYVLVVVPLSVLAAWRFYKRSKI